MAAPHRGPGGRARTRAGQIRGSTRYSSGVGQNSQASTIPIHTIGATSLANLREISITMLPMFSSYSIDELRFWDYAYVGLAQLPVAPTVDNGVNRRRQNGQTRSGGFWKRNEAKAMRPEYIHWYEVPWAQKNRTGGGFGRSRGTNWSGGFAQSAADVDDGLFMAGSMYDTGPSLEPVLHDSEHPQTGVDSIANSAEKTGRLTVQLKGLYLSEEEAPAAPDVASPEATVALPSHLNRTHGPKFRRVMHGFNGSLAFFPDILASDGQYSCKEVDFLCVSNMDAATIYFPLPVDTELFNPQKNTTIVEEKDKIIFDVFPDKRELQRKGINSKTPSILSYQLRPGIVVSQSEVENSLETKPNVSLLSFSPDRGTVKVLVSDLRAFPLTFTKCPECHPEADHG